MLAPKSQSAGGEIGETQTRSPATPHGEMPVCVGLAGAAVELQRAASCAQALQSSLSPLLRRAGEGVFAGQALDDLTQHLDGLATFLAAIARDCPPQWRFDAGRAAEQLKLHTQKIRLIHDDPTLGVTSYPSGELELW